MQNIIFITFSDSKGTPMLRRIRKEAEESSFFDEIYTFTEKDFEKSYFRQHKDCWKLRGFGYWMWKSYLVRRTFLQMNEGDILVYADGGCTINGMGKKRYEDYLNLANEMGVIFEQQGLTEKLYTKADLLNHVGEIDNPAITNTDQIWAGAFMLRKCKEITDFVNRWYDVCHNHFELITDKDSKLPNAKGFITHRHDQSAFSVLVKGYHLAVVSANETFTGNFQDELADFPIWATRKRQYTWWYLKKDGLKKRLNKLFNK